MKLSKLFITLASALGIMTALLFGATSSLAAVNNADILTSPSVLLQSDDDSTEEEGGGKKKDEEEEEPDC